MRSRLLLVSLLVATVALAGLGVPAAAHNEGLPSVPLLQWQMTHLQNLPNLGGNALDFFERKLADGTIKRYAVAATQGNGFDILDITEPEHPVTVGRYLLPDNSPANATQSSAGVNYHAWVSVNPRRNIVALTIEEPAGRTARHNGAVGIQFVDITDVTNPKALGKIDGIDGPHTVRMIGDNHAYTSLNTWVVDYTDPRNPTAAKRAVEGHEFYEDPNVPGRMYVGMATTTGRWGMFDIRNPGDPVQIGSWPDLKITAAHEVYPAPDSSYVGVSDFTTGQQDTTCPGGGVHFYRIADGAGAPLGEPQKLGTWFAPYAGRTSVSPVAPPAGPNSASCTLHSWQHHPERSIALAGLYSGGTWVFNPAVPTRDDGLYREYNGPRGKTTWGETLGNIIDAGDYVNAAQWLPFDMADVDDERLVYTNGTGRGLDVYRYTGPLPPKQSRFTLSPTAKNGAVEGRLERFAVLTHEGWRNLPLAGRTIQVAAAGRSVTVTTGADGRFTAPLALASGSTAVTATWPGDERFAPNIVTRTVTS